MYSGFCIREAVPGDSSVYQSYLDGLFGENLDTLVPRLSAPSREEAQEWMLRHQRGNGVVLLAEASGELVGSLNLTRIQRPQLDHSLLMGLNVRRDHRGQGVGRRLLEAGVAWFERVDRFERIELDVLSNNAPAICLYVGAGFGVEGIKRRAVRRAPGEYLDLLLMSRFRAA